MIAGYYTVNGILAVAHTWGPGTSARIPVKMVLCSP